MISVESSTLIERPVEDVFAYASDQTNEPEWHTDVLEIRPAPASPGKGLGSRWLVAVSFMGRNEYEVEVTGLEENQRVEITTRTGPLKPTTTYLFVPERDNTRFTRQVNLPVDGFMRLMTPFVRARARNRNEQFVVNLKQRLESDS